MMSSFWVAAKRAPLSRPAAKRVAVMGGICDPDRFKEDVSWKFGICWILLDDKLQLNYCTPKYTYV